MHLVGSIRRNLSCCTATCTSNQSISSSCDGQACQPSDVQTASGAIRVKTYGTNLPYGRRFQAFAVISILYMFFWVFPWRQYVICRRFGTMYQFHLQRLEVVCGPDRPSPIPNHGINCLAFTYTTQTTSSL